MKSTHLMTAVLISNILLGGIAWGQGKALEIVEGYGKTQWGQSVEEVTKILGDDAEVGARKIRVTGEAPVVEINYDFLQDRLHRVRVTYDFPGKPKSGTDHHALKTLNQLIAKKYRADPQVKMALKQADIYISVSSVNNGRVQVNYFSEKVTEIARKAKKEAQQKKRLENMSSEDKEERSKIFGALKDEL